MTGKKVIHRDLILNNEILRLMSFCLWVIIKCCWQFGIHKYNVNEQIWQHRLFFSRVKTVLVYVGCSVRVVRLLKVKSQVKL